MIRQCTHDLQKQDITYEYDGLEQHYDQGRMNKGVRKGVGGVVCATMPILGPPETIHVAT